MACENSQWARISWVDSNSGRGNFYTKHPPVSYQLISNTPTFTGGQCPNVQYKVQVRVRGATTHPLWVTSYGCNVPIVWRSTAFNGKIRGLVEKTNNALWVQYTHPVLGDIESLFSLDGDESNSLRWAFGCAQANSPYLYLKESAEIIGVIRVDGQPDNCGNLPSTCELKVTDARGLVFTKIFDGSCPTVRIECSNNKCPTNTCEVDCHGHKCCYNAQGQVVKVIGA